eukprot:1118374-Rhodomonas_salina.2
MSGTDLGHTWPGCGAQEQDFGIVLRTRYAMSGTDIGYACRRPTLPLCDVQYGPNLHSARPI